MRRSYPIVLILLVFTGLTIHLLSLFIPVGRYYNPASGQSASLYQYTIVLGIGLFYLCAAMFCYLRNPASIIIRRSTYLLLTLGCAIAFSVPSSIYIPSARLSETVALLFSGYLMMLFFESFPAAVKPAFYKMMRRIVLSISIALSVAVAAAFLSGISRISALDEVVLTVAIILLSLSFISTVSLIALHLHSNSSRIRNQMSILTGALVLSLAPVLCLSLIPYAFYRIHGIPFYYSLIPIIILPVTLAYLLVKQEIIDIQLKMEQFIVHALASAAALILLVTGLRFVPADSAVIAGWTAVLFLAAYSLIKQLIYPLYRRKRTSKTQAIQQGKQRILQQAIKEKHLASCARLIVSLIHQIVAVDGICLLWKQAGRLRVVEQTGRFRLRPPSDRLIMELMSGSITQTADIHMFPLADSGTIKGGLLIGKKINGTSFDKSERELLKTIQSDALELLISTEALSDLGKKLSRTEHRFLTQEQLNRALLRSSEAEKRRLSVFLHDEVLQNVILIENKAEYLHDRHLIEERAYLDIKNVLINSIYEIREKSRELHPFMVEDLGLEKSLGALKRKLQRDYNVTIRMACRLQLKLLPKDLAVQAYRMIRELLTNAVKHSEATAIFVSVEDQKGQLTLRVKDEGRGFDVSKSLSDAAQNGHLGLMTIQKRIDRLNGSLTIDARPGRGADFTITLPIDWSHEHADQRDFS